MAGESLTWFDAPSAATNEDIAIVENAIGNRFPEDYRQFAKHYSGGSPNETDFEFADGPDAFYASAGEFFTLKPKDNRNLLRRMELTEFFPAGLVPLAGDGGGGTTFVLIFGPSTAVPPWSFGTMVVVV